MLNGIRTVVMTVTAIAFASGCVSDGNEGSEADTTDAVPDISVTVPPERLTPFCETMIALSDQLRTENIPDDEALIIDTYRSIQSDVPPEISADFDAVLAALDTGAPAPTDPPLPTIPSTTTIPSASTTTTTTTTTVTPDPSGSSVPTEASAPTTAPGVDVGYADGHSPSERINNYVSFACRDTQNNPGPPATQPLEPSPTSEP